MAFAFERNQNLAIAAADGRTVAEGEIEPAVGDPDVVDDRIDLAGRNDTADFIFDVSEDYFRLFDARTGGRAGVQAKLTRIDSRKEVAADEMD